MTNLHLDFESRSAVDLKKAGIYVYSQDETTDSWCAAYALDDGPIQLWTPDGDEGDVRYALKHADTITAHNAAFERVLNQFLMARKYGWPEPNLTQWRCTMSMALAMALPGSLDGAAAAVGLDIRKDMDGHNTMMRMCRPRRPRKGELPDGIYWFDDDERKQKLYAYCKNDVAVERELEKRLLPLRPSEQKLWWLDQAINDRGVFVDDTLCNAALKIVDTAADWLDEEMRVVTGGQVQACSNVGQITGWLRANGCPDVDSIAKGAIDDLLCLDDLSAGCRRVLELRREAAKASVAKIDALLTGRNTDGRARGLLQYHAASTGRWGGRRFQPQNIVRPSTEDTDVIDEMIEAVSSGDADLVQMLFGEPLAVVGDCLRGMVRAAPGAKIMAADFSNIEGRVAAWYGNQKWKLDAFRDYDAGKGPDIYLVTAAKIYEVAVETLTKKSPEREVGKRAELAFGFQGGVGAWRKFEVFATKDARKFSDEEVDDFKKKWREKNDGISACWYELEEAVVEAIENRGSVVACLNGRIKFRCAGSFLFMQLPSGRAICYPYPRLEMRPMPWKKRYPEWVPCQTYDEGHFLYGEDMTEFDEVKRRARVYLPAEKQVFIYKGVDTYTRKWCDQTAHGGMLFNNVVQGTARDLMAEAMFRLELRGYPVVLSVHDELVAEPAIDHGSVEEFSELMTALPPWADGLPVAVGAWQAERYRK